MKKNRDSPHRGAMNPSFLKALLNEIRSMLSTATDRWCVSLQYLAVRRSPAISGPGAIPMRV